LAGALNALERRNMAEKLITEISPGCVRIIIEIGGKTGAGDFLVDVLPQWIESLETSSDQAMVHGTEEGTALACEIAFDAIRLEEWDLACIAALWIILHAPGQRGISMNDLKNMAGIGVLRIIANADGSIWHSEASLYSTDIGATIH
jgi:hypothetical protein